MSPMPGDARTSGFQEQVRFGLLGCGAVSAKHVEAFSHVNNASLVAVADPLEDRARAAAVRVGADVYSDYRFILERHDIDAVIIATPSGLHAKMALEALEAQKHVLVEKPMAMTIQDADRMIEMARSNRKNLGVVYHNRFNRASRVLKAALDDGQLGKLVCGTVSVKWYRPQQYYTDSGWRGTEAMDGGVLMNQAIHHIDLLLWYMGEVTELSGYRATLGHDMEMEDTAVVSLRFRSGALGSVEATTCAYPENLEETLTIIGTRGSVIMGGKKLDSFAHWCVPAHSVLDGLETRPPWYGHYEVLKDFVEGVIDHRPPLVDGVEGRKSLAFVRTVYERIPLARPAGGGTTRCDRTR